MTIDEYAIDYVGIDGSRAELMPENEIVSLPLRYRAPSSIDRTFKGA